MINTTRGTKNWSTAVQENQFKQDPTQHLSTIDKEALKGQNVGDVLNQIADPSWVDPAKTRKVGNNELDKDAFFKLMLAQMKNQDPTNPLQSHEMAAQLAQFSQLEQLSNINASIDALKTNQDPTSNYAAIQLVGKTVSADTSLVTRAKGDKIHEVRFTAPSDIKTVDVSVMDASGKVVRKLNQVNLKKGENKVVWNGILDDGSVARAGDYRLGFEAKDSGDKKVSIVTAFKGKITGLNFTKEGPLMMVGDQAIRLSDIKKIEDEDSKQVQKQVESAKVAPKGPIALKDETDESKLPSADPELVPDIGNVQGTGEDTPAKVSAPGAKVATNP